VCAAIDVDGIRRTSIHHCRRYAVGQRSCRWANHSRPAAADRRIRAIWRSWGPSSNWTENRGKPEPSSRRLLTPRSPRLAAMCQLDLVCLITLPRSVVAHTAQIESCCKNWPSRTFSAKKSRFDGAVRYGI
jgi:hypothetical protein